MEASNLDITQVKNWQYEDSAAHSRPVPAMPSDERRAWVELSHKAAGGTPLSHSQLHLLMALDRKIRFRARFDLTSF